MLAKADMDTHAYITKIFILSMSQNFRQIRLFCLRWAQAGKVEAEVPACPGRASQRGKGTKPIQDAQAPFIIADKCTSQCHLGLLPVHFSPYNDVFLSTCPLRTASITKTEEETSRLLYFGDIFRLLGEVSLKGRLRKQTKCGFWLQVWRHAKPEDESWIIGGAKLRLQDSSGCTEHLSLSRRIHMQLLCSLSLTLPEFFQVTVASALPLMGSSFGFLIERPLLPYQQNCNA